ncbi:MAG: hypothetical protein HYU76_12570 [Betaproteobacteria bacterium]|nr:hypothetical protein [Betaproteobacteria bacterium]
MKYSRSAPGPAPHRALTRPGACVNVAGSIINRLNQAVHDALAAPDIRQRFPELGVEARPATPEAFRELLISEIAKWKAVIEKAKIPRQ